MFTEQCIGIIFFSGNIKFKRVNTDFLVSPAYCVPAIRIIFLSKLTIIPVSLFVPCCLGSIFKFGKFTIVYSLENFLISLFFGLINKCLANKPCQAYSVITETPKLLALSAPPSRSCTKRSLLFEYSIKVFNILSKFSSLIGTFVFPQWIFFSFFGSLTKNLSLADLPVCFPVLTTRAPCLDNFPSLVL